MTAFKIIISGVVGTAIMTAFMILCSTSIKRKISPVHILASMLPTLFQSPGSATPAYNRPVALMVHYAIGILFTLIYSQLVASEFLIKYTGIGAPLMLGFCYGAVGVIGWAIFLRLHPAPLRTVPWSIFFPCIFIAHFFFTFAMITAFALW